MKKVFVAFTEQGRVRGKISGSILKLENKFQFSSEFQFSSTSNRGTKAEVVNALVKSGELPEEALDKAGYPNYEVVDKLADIAIIEGRGLNYFQTI